ncbi:Panacea domain-containing protein [Allorhodopirellula solitaria]|uniref:Antitoxin SocA-like Panacea domain-containing protein n=1 Tax=Allorhodopirellula solitaria TaxID=2527987 RepID=A0A5C5YF55_9BACT|nr:Panacea domain-containing protein [Allorhodopirellula solitaria]TWT74357.1 hypothetical protein CA85_12450 [Allorhodopirellula solitaria]
MTKLKNATLYVCQNYPHANELSKARLTKTIYLADWKSAIEHGRQLTDITWVFNHFGPYVDDVFNMAVVDEDFIVERTASMYGDAKNVIAARPNIKPIQVEDADKTVLDHVIETTKNKSYTSFIKLVYSTYPIVSQPRYADLNLVQLALVYKRIMKTIDEL